MALDNFHPSVANWFRKAFDAPTEIQTKAWPEIQKHQNTLISAPTGSGKTLAAFLSAINDLIRQGLEGTLPDQTQVVYVSPLKALSNDIEWNLQIPLRGIEKELKDSSLPEIKLRVFVRTGDTTSSVRTKMTKTELIRIGLSATQKPIETGARFLIGSHRISESGELNCTIN